MIRVMNGDNDYNNLKCINKSEGETNESVFT